MTTESEVGVLNTTTIAREARESSYRLHSQNIERYAAQMYKAHEAFRQLGGMLTMSVICGIVALALFLLPDVALALGVLGVIVGSLSLVGSVGVPFFGVPMLFFWIRYRVLRAKVDQERTALESL